MDKEPDEKSFDELLDLICQNLETSADGKAVYTLLIGAGFSSGVIPTTSEILKNAPVWLYKPNSQNNRQETPSDTEIYETFWKKAADKNKEIELDQTTSFPTHISDAYKFLMSTNCPGGLTTPKLRREYMRYLCSTAAKKNNPAHLFLAYLLGQQQKACWKYPAKFCRTILTTNFDALLQDALQLANVLYYMSDRPEVLDHIQEDEHDAIHLVYTHGSIHRYRLLNSSDEIEEGTQRNSSSLKSHFERHGVIVIGYGGWKDATMKALEQASQFDGNLYWCVRSRDSLAKNVEELLLKHRGCAFKVVIPDADEAMSKIFERLTGFQDVELISDPMTLLIERMGNLSISEPVPTDSTDKSTYIYGFNSRVGDSINRLKAAREIYIHPEMLEGQNHITKSKIKETQSKAVVSKYMEEILTLIKKRSFSKTIQLCNTALAISSIPAKQKATLLTLRGFAYGMSKPAKRDVEIADYTAVIAMADAPAEQKAGALFNRGITYGELVPPKREEQIADYTAIIQMADVPSEQKAMILFNRGNVYGKLVPPKREEQIADYTAIIQMADVLPEQKAKALLNRGITYGELVPPKREEQIADYTAVIQMTNVSPEKKAKALLNRGSTYGELVPPKIEEQIADYTAVIQMTDVPPEQKAKALVGRGGTYGELVPPKREAEIADYTAVIEMPEAPGKYKGTAHGNLGLLYFEEDDDPQSLLQETIKALKYEDNYAWHYNTGLAKLFMGTPSEALDPCLSAIKKCNQVEQIDWAIELLKAKESILPKQSRDAYEVIIKTLYSRKDELKMAMAPGR